MFEQNASYLVKHSDLGAKNLHKICLKIVQEVLKLATTVSKFSKIFRSSTPPDPPYSLFILNMLQINSAKNTTLEMYVKFWWLLSEKISEYATHMKKFFKELLTSFLGLISFHLVNVQLIQNFIPLHQNFLDPFLSAGSRFFRTPLPFQICWVCPLVQGDGFQSHIR